MHRTCEHACTYAGCEHLHCTCMYVRMYGTGCKENVALSSRGILNGS